MCWALVSPQRGVVELYPQQVPHSCLSRIVDDELVVKQRVSFSSRRSGLYARSHWNSHSVSGKERRLLHYITLKQITGKLSINWFSSWFGLTPTSLRFNAAWSRTDYTFHSSFVRSDSFVAFVLFLINSNDSTLCNTHINVSPVWTVLGWDLQNQRVFRVRSGLSQALDAVFPRRQFMGLIVSVEQLVTVSQRHLQSINKNNAYKVVSSRMKVLWK